MLYKTPGIALSHIKYRDTSIIARIFTAEFGLQSYIVNGVRSPKAKNKMGHFQPLTLLDLVVYHRPGKDIQRISEMRCRLNFSSIPFDIRKTTMALFMAEFMVKSLHTEENNQELFDFAESAIAYFDQAPEGYENFHLQYLLKMMVFFGISPLTARQLLDEVQSPLRQDDAAVAHLQQMLRVPFGYVGPMGKSLRSSMLEDVLAYYRYHFDSIRDLKSLAILKEVFS
jgi:DNA repair protein RecO (recombination protein O)